MRKVFKYTIEPNDYFTLSLPFGAQILSVQEQDGHPRLWALVDPHEERVELHTFRFVGTGHGIEDLNMIFIDTIQFKELGLVFHVFEVSR